MKLRGIDKKGEMSPLAVIITAIVIIIVAGMLIYTFTGFFKEVNKAKDLGPGDFELIAQFCKGYSEGGLKIDYCKLREVDSNFYNCRYISENYGADYDFEDISLCEDVAKNFCNERVKQKDLADTEMNGVPCISIPGVTGIVPKTCEGLGGTWKDASCITNEELDITLPAADSGESENAGKYCCISLNQ